jgi:hypothetical protein
MSTQKQINANRQNAKKSTGPKSDEGKATVSQNAIKHGLFAQSVVFGENEADYEVFHDNMLAELAPVGVVESMLAERAVNLAWRLRRAERMQNEVIEDMIGRKVTTNPARRARENYYYNQGRRPDELGVDLDELPLGRIATNDFAYCRVLDRMLMYERRIENSMIKTMRELERRQIIRQFQQQEAEQELEPSPSLRDEAATQKSNQYRLAPSTAGGSIKDLKKQNQYNRSASCVQRAARTDLKKQSQSVPGQNGATSYLKGDYGNNSLAGENKNKANQSQLQREIQHVKRLRGRIATAVRVCQ